jgi:hypothetical protein
MKSERDKKIGKQDKDLDKGIKNLRNAAEEDFKALN